MAYAAGGFFEKVLSELLEVHRFPDSPLEFERPQGYHELGQFWWWYVRCVFLPVLALGRRRDIIAVAQCNGRCLPEQEIAPNDNERVRVP